MTRYQSFHKEMEALKIQYCPQGVFDKNWRYINGIDDAIATHVRIYGAESTSEESGSMQSEGI
jgi:hypothetical protein